MTGPFRSTADEQTITLHPSSQYDAEVYRRGAHTAGMTEAMRLLVGDPAVPHSGRPGAALRRLARTVSEELACLGYAGIPIRVGEGMARVIAANRIRQARQSVPS